MSASAIYSLPIQDFTCSAAFTAADNAEIQLPIAVQQGDRSRVLFEIMAVEYDMDWNVTGTQVNLGSDIEFHFGLFSQPLVALADSHINDPYTLVRWHVHFGLANCATGNADGPGQYMTLGDLPKLIDCTMNGMKQGILVATDKIYVNAALGGTAAISANPKLYMRIWYRLRSANLEQYTRLLLQQRSQY